MRKKEKKEFYIVDKRALPQSIQSVIKVNELISKLNISKYEAIKRVGVSRSTYYKYKDFIKPFYESGKEKIYGIHMTLMERAGILSDVLKIIAAEKLSVLSVAQTMVIDDEAKATILIKLTQTTKKIEDIIERMREINGVKNIRVTGNN